MTTPYTRPRASWSAARRERWGLRANELEAAGLNWRDAERQAFEELKGGDDPEPESVPQPTVARPVKARQTTLI